MNDAAVKYTGREPGLQAPPASEGTKPKLEVKGFSLRFSPLRSYDRPVEALSNISLDVGPNGILSIIGPARSGKTTLLRCINRLIELSHNAVREGDISIDGRSIFGSGVDISELRRNAGMVFARPVVLPMSIRENIAYGLRVKGVSDNAAIDGAVEGSLRASYLWDEVKDRLSAPAASLSGGQQQRLCIARVIAMKPGMIMLDEPTSALDPISTSRIEDTLTELKAKYTIILVTNNTKQAARVGDRSAFFLMGKLIEHGPTGKLFTSPDDRRTEDYITGRFG